MKKEPDFGWVPVITSPACSALTLANWENAGLRRISLHLASLLMKPGYIFLDALSDIRSYYAWPHQIILNALLPAPKGDGIYRFRSHYDGGLISIDIPTLVALIFKLQPDVVVLPPEAAGVFHQFLLQKPIPMQAYIPKSENLPGLGVTAKAGFSIQFNAKGVFADLLKEIDDRHKNYYLTGDFSLNQLKTLANYSNCLVESNKIVEDGMQGIVYSSKGTVNILDAHMEEDYNLIDKNCHCETCHSQFTRSYLHHLLQHTPLLAQRFLVQHNVRSFLQTTFTLGQNPYMMSR